MPRSARQGLIRNRRAVPGGSRKTHSTANAEYIKDSDNPFVDKLWKDNAGHNEVIPVRSLNRTEHANGIPVRTVGIKNTHAAEAIKDAVICTAR